jgi:hypothetical protein
MADRASKVAIIGLPNGSDKEEGLRWDCFDWNTSTSRVNLHDYDVWVLYLPSFKQPPPGSVFYLLTPDYVYEALLQNTQIFVVGDPRIEAPNEFGIKEAFLCWTGYAFDWKNKVGDTIEFVPDSDYFLLHSYLAEMRSWNYALASVFQAPRYHASSVVRRLMPHKCIELSLEPIARNRAKESVAFTLILTLYRAFHGEWVFDKKLGTITFVPLLSNDAEADLRRFLEGSLSISLEENPPEWIAAINAPGQEKVDEEILQLGDEIQRLQQSLRGANDHRNTLRECLGLLYQGNSKLEDIVRDILQKMGAMVEVPTERNKEDGWITVMIGESTVEGVLEIKSTGKPQFTEEGVRQINDWIGRGKVNRHKTYRGVFIGNSSIKQEPSKREFPFSDSWVKAAKLIPITALTTEALFRAYELFAAGKLDMAKFWTAIFSTDGVVVMEKLLEECLMAENAPAQGSMAEQNNI